MTVESHKRYEFINRIHVKEYTVISVILKIIISIITCLILFFVMIPIFFEGIGILLFIGTSIILVRYIIRFGIRKVGCMQIRTIFDFYSDRLVMRYDYIDREDDMGPRSEEYTFYYRDIIDLEYSVPLQCLNIKCGPILKIHYHRNSKEVEKDYTRNKKYYKNLIYLPQNKIDEFLKDIQQYSGINVKELH